MFSLFCLSKSTEEEEKKDPEQQRKEELLAQMEEVEKQAQQEVQDVEMVCLFLSSHSLMYLMTTA